MLEDAQLEAECFMKHLLLFGNFTKSLRFLIILVGFSLLEPFAMAQTPAPVPPAFQDLYSQMEGYLNSFNATLNSSWDGSKYPVLYAGDLSNANANNGPQLLGPTYLQGVKLQLLGLKAMGFPAVRVQVAFPMLYEPFFSSQAEYQEYVNFYSQVASIVRASGMKLIVENNSLLSTGIFAGWNTAAFYASLDWTQYQQARAQTAVVVAQTMHPDYLSVLEEPDTEAQNSGQSQVNTVSGATGMVSLMLSALQKAGVTGLKIGAGVGTWHPQYLAFTQSFVTLPMDFMDMHIYPVNNGYLYNALTMASTAAAAGKLITMTECWLNKVRDTELGILNFDQIAARNPFNFWEPLDIYFLQTMQALGNYTKMAFIAPFSSNNFRADLPYDSSTQSLTPSQIQAMENQQASLAIQQALFTGTGLSFYRSLISQPDAISPATPTNLTGVSGAPTTAYLSWNPSTDNVGVAGYYVFRNGVQIASTAQTFYQDSGLTGATTYSYFVSAFDLGANKASSSTVSVRTRDVDPPNAPTNLVPIVASCKKITLTWSPAVDNVALAAYYVFRGTTPTTLSQVQTTRPTILSVINYPLTPGTKYYFAVQAVDTSGNLSLMSPVVAATTLAAPSAPTGLVATALAKGQIGLTWAAGPSGMPIAAYYIFRGTAPSALSQVGVTTKLSYTNYSLTSGTKYYYAVQAKDSGGNVSPLSAVASATAP